jgi:hypothetical protein
MGAPVWSYRCDSSTALNARHSNFDKYGASIGTVSVDADAAFIGGFKLNLYQGSVGTRYLGFIGKQNLPSSRVWSIHVGFSVPFSGSPAANTGLFLAGSHVTTAPPCHISLYIATDGTIRMYMVNETGALMINNVAVCPAFAFVANTRYDLVVTVTGDTTASGVKTYFDAVLKTSNTAAQAWGAGAAYDNKRFDSIILGAANNLKTTQVYVQDVNIWNEIIDPTAVTLTTGSGSLNGNSRTAFVDSSAFEGGSYTQLSEANVANGVPFTYNGTAYTGSLSFPSVSDIATAVWNHAKALTIGKFLGLKKK